jgi:protein PhnA
MDANHWRCLNDSMWNPEPAVQKEKYRAYYRFFSIAIAKIM